MQILRSQVVKWSLTGLLAGASVLAWALPTPKDIEASVQAGHLTQAEQQLREVLAEKPTSARAHYELGQVLAREGRYDEALAALRQAKLLDSSLKFATSAQQFDKVLSAVADKAKAARSHETKPSGALSAPPPVVQASAGPAAVAAKPVSPPPVAHASGGWSWWWGLLAVVGVAWLAMRLWQSSRQGAGRTPAAAPAWGAGRQEPTYSPALQPYGPGYPAAQSGAGGMARGAVLGGLAGLAAGYALSRTLDDHHGNGVETDRNGDPRTGASSGASTGSGDYIPFDSSPTDAGFGAFDAGPGDSWGGSDGGDAGNNDW